MEKAGRFPSAASLMTFGVGSVCVADWVYRHSAMLGQIAHR